MANLRHSFVIFQWLLAASYNADAACLRGTNYTAADKNTTDSQESNGSCIIPSSDCRHADNSLIAPENAFYGLNGDGALKTNGDGIYTYTNIHGEPCDLDVTGCEDDINCITLTINDNESAYNPARTGFFSDPQAIWNVTKTGFGEDGYIMCAEDNTQETTSPQSNTG